MKQRLYDFMNSHPHLVVSSIDKDGKPQSEVVGFGQTEELELIVGTSNDSRKAENIKSNPNVSVVIGWGEEGTIQYEGTARILLGKEADKYSEIYFKKNPTARRYKEDPHETYILITPTWLRFTEVAHYPWTIHEYNYESGSTPLA